MAITSLIRKEVAKRLNGQQVFTESQAQYCKLPAILVETPSVRSLDAESHYAKQVSLTITAMLKDKKNAPEESEKLCDSIMRKMQQRLPGTLSQQWVETSFELNTDQEQPLVIAKLYYEIIIGD